MVKPLVAHDIDEARVSLRRPENHVNGVVRKRHPIGASAGDVEAVRNVFANADTIERRSTRLAPTRDGRPAASSGL